MPLPSMLAGVVCDPAPGPSMCTPSLQAVCDCISPELFDVLTWLGYCNSTMNPIIYPLFMRDFKRALGRFLPCSRCLGERRASLASPSMRTSHSGPRPGLSLQHVLPLPRPPDSNSDSGSASGGSSGLQRTAQPLLPREAPTGAPSLGQGCRGGQFLQHRSRGVPAAAPSTWGSHELARAWSWSVGSCTG